MLPRRITAPGPTVRPLPLQADPWLVWHEMQPKPTPPDRLGVIAERHPDKPWPPALGVPRVYASSRFGTGSVTNDLAAIRELRKQLVRLKVCRPVRPQLLDALPAMHAVGPPSGPAAGLTGKDVIVGFVDNGCAFAHPNFMRQDDPDRSRVTRLWDQTTREAPPGPKWTPSGFGYGYELAVGSETLPPVAQRIGDKPYTDLNYRLTELVAGVPTPSEFTHGTHVMDIAAGSGRIGGIAPGAELVFVQLPEYAIEENTDQASARHILDGIAYVFARAAEKRRPAVVNVSYNAYTGPHDGTSLLERGLDELLKEPNRAVVISAGNGGDARCHAGGSLEPRHTKTLSWIIQPDDDTVNFVELWYSDVATVEIVVTTPSGMRSPAVPPGHMVGLGAEGRTGAVIHRANDPGNHKNQALIAVNPTRRHADLGKARAEAGTWTIELKHVGGPAVDYNAWIERDDRGANPRSEQSRFAWDESQLRNTEPRFTLGGMCTGQKPIVVGAYNAVTKKVLAYSSRGPTVAADDREKPRRRPDVCAPGASDPLNMGILATAARSGNLLRVGGTSMAAPFVTGLIARMFELATTHHRRDLTIDTIRDVLTATAVPIETATVDTADAGADPLPVDIPATPASTGAGAIDVQAALEHLEAILSGKC
jgi:subtilisin family serine protease